MTLNDLEIPYKDYGGLYVYYFLYEPKQVLMSFNDYSRYTTNLGQLSLPSSGIGSLGDWGVDCGQETLCGLIRQVAPSSSEIEFHYELCSSLLNFIVLTSYEK